MVLAFEAGEPETMLRKPRKPEEGVFNGLMVKEVLVSGMAIAIVAFVIWAWLIGKGYEENWARNPLLL
jgi:magnesium-transporting ATPase (P-type)